MKKLTDIINYNTSTALGWTLIHSIWQGFAILLAFGILYYIFKPSVTRYRLGIGALTLQFVAAIATFFTVYQPVSPSATLPSNQAFGNFFLNNPNLIFTPKKLTLLQQIEFFLQNNLDVFVMIWMVGTTLLLLRLLVGFTHVQSLKVQQVNPISADIQALMNSLLEKAQMPATIKLLESARASVPMTIGWIKPVVLLPIGMASGLTIKQLEAILAHELAHIKRYDYLVNIFQNFIEILFFFHPATWFISGKVRDERENCCDDFAVEICGDSLVLAKALTQVASYQQQPRLAMAFGAKRQTFMDRIKRIIGINDSKPMSYGNWAAVMGMILVVALGVVYAQKEVAKENLSSEKNSNVKRQFENKLDFYFFEIQNKNIGVYKNNQGEIEKILVAGNELEGKEFAEMKLKVIEFFKDKNADFTLIKGIVPAEMNQLKNQFFFENIASDTSKLELVEAEMEVLSKEMEKYSKEMEVLSRQMEEKGGRQMDKLYKDLAQYSDKMQVPQRKIQDLSIEMQEVSLAMQKIHNKYRDSDKMPAEAEQKIKALEKQERVLEKQMHEVEQQIHTIEAEMRPIDDKISRLPMDSLGRLMERYEKPMDSLSKIMEEKGKVLEKLAQEEEARFKKQIRTFADMLFSEGLIKNKTDFEVRLKGEKLLIDLEPQSAAVYEKVWNWIYQNWGTIGTGNKITLQKDLTIGLKGDDFKFQKAWNKNGAFYQRTGSLSVPTPPAPRNFRSSASEVAPPPPPPTRARTPSTPKPPKPVRVGVVDKNFQITDGLIRDNKGTCSVYVVVDKDGKSIAKAVPVQFKNKEYSVDKIKVSVDGIENEKLRNYFVKAIPAQLKDGKWTAKGLKVGDKVILKSDVKVKNGDAVKLLAINN